MYDIIDVLIKESLVARCLGALLTEVTDQGGITRRKATIIGTTERELL